MFHLLTAATCIFIAHCAIAQDSYDPLMLPAGSEPESVDLQVQDKDRQREIPLRVYLPSSKQPAGVVMFSHGLGGSCKGNAYLGNHWSGRGYVAVFMQHAGSDEAVWKDEPVLKRVISLKKAASFSNLTLRVEDVKAVLDQLARWHDQPGHPLGGRLDLSRVGMSGHSFGGQTTQAVSGQAFGRRGQRYSDKRIKAAIVFSPSSPKLGDPKQAFEAVKIPWLLMTGTHDTALVGGQTVESRQAVYPALPDGDKYQLVLHEAEHSAFSDRALPGDKLQRNPNHHRAILAMSTAFWDAHLNQDSAAKSWLNGAGPRSVLESEDHWDREKPAW